MYFHQFGQMNFIYCVSSKVCLIIMYAFIHNCEQTNNIIEICENTNYQFIYCQKIFHFKPTSLNYPVSVHSSEEFWLITNTP